MANWHTDETDALLKAILKLETLDECYAFFEDVCTIKEIIDIAQRLKIARLLKEKTSYNEIIRETGVSAATISRVSRCLEYGSGGYNMMLERMENGDKND